MVSSLPVCSRCGKVSILKNVWEEKIETRQGTSIIKHEQFICPDPDCQVAVEEALVEKQKQAEEREQASKEREELRVLARTRRSS